MSRRLFAVIVMALLMGLVFGGLRVASAESSASQFGRVSQLATLGQRLTVLIQDLQNERDETLSVMLGKINVANAALAPVEAATNSAIPPVRQAASAIGGAFSPNIQTDAATVLADITPGRMASLRSALSTTAPLSEQAVIDNYAAVVGDMITLADQVSQGVSDATLDSDVRAFNGLALAKEQASQQRGLLNYLFSEKAGPNDGSLQVDPGTLEALQVANGSEFTDESAFQSAATPAQLAFFSSSIQSQTAVTDIGYAQELELAIFGNAGASPAVSLLDDVQQGIGNTNPATNMGPVTNLTQGQQVWDAGMGDLIGGMQSTESLLADDIASRAQQLQSGASGSALLSAIITAVVLLLVLAAALLVARSLVLPLRRLRAGALDVASVQLPERVRQLSESPETAGNMDVAPIPVLSADEIGQVARAFDQVHQEAVRLAGEEAVLRTSFNAMFVNLSRRTQSLVERLARMIDSLEQNEDDPDRLSNLFSMDHLVTRMRRNSENLLLLAGHESARKWSEPVSLADVTRAAVSEIEQYNRVVLNVQPGVAVIGQAVSDVVHLLAELIENATIFSPKDTPVQVSAQELSSGGVLIDVTDRGIGVSESRLAEMNWRLDNTPAMDVSVSRHMGLFAVARLAERHRIRVRLRPASPQGLTALVWLPDTVIERSGRLYGGTGSWQQPVTASEGSFLQSRRASGQHSVVTASAAGQRTTGRHSIMQSIADNADTASRDAGSSLPAHTGMGGQVSQATSNWFRSRHTAMGAASRMPVNTAESGNGGTGNGYGNGTGYGSGSSGGSVSGLPTRIPQSGSWGSDTSSGWSEQPDDGLGSRSEPGSQSGGWGSETGGWGPEISNRTPGGRRPQDIVAQPVQGDQTAAGLPMRVPKANLIPGSAGGTDAFGSGPAGGGGSTGGGPAGGSGRMGAGGGTEQSLPQRSPDLARSRLSGFQRGARRAERDTSRPGEGTDR